MGQSLKDHCFKFVHEPSELIAGLRVEPKNILNQGPPRAQLPILGTTSHKKRASRTVFYEYARGGSIALCKWWKYCF